MINGVVNNVIKNSFSRDWEDMQDSSGQDILKELGDIFKEEAEYCHNL